MGGVRRGGRRASKMTGTGSKGKRKGAKAKRTVSAGGRKYTVLGSNDSLLKGLMKEKNLPFRKRKNKIDIKETGLR